MAGSPQLDKIIQGLRERSANPPKTPEEGRQRYEAMVESFPVDDDVRTEKVAAGGVAAEWITAPGAEDGNTLLYFHGGGFVIGSIRSHREMLSRISRAAGSRVSGLGLPAGAGVLLPGPRWKDRRCRLSLAAKPGEGPQDNRHRRRLGGRRPDGLDPGGAALPG